ncbi:MAG TPA: SpoIIE family protein phosphatase [Planctomycetota bacterium]|nr:SpoIIE family protein phosphatase [Planctomycetota bacterium]
MMEDDSSTILIVTQDPLLGSSLAAEIAREGHRVTLVSPSEMRDKPHLPARAVFVDARDGSAATREAAIREAAVETSYVVAVGKLYGTGEVLAAMRTGARDYISEELRPAELAEVLARIVAPREIPQGVIEYQDRGGETRKVILRGKTVTLGRDPSNDICIDSAIVSRFHARIILKGGQYSIIDNGSRHGIHINNQRVDEAVLSDGTCARLGTSGSPVIVFRSEERPVERTWGEPPPESGHMSSQEMKDIASLLDTFVKLNGDLVLDDVLQIVLARSIEFADAERGMILLVESRGDATGASRRTGDANGEGEAHGDEERYVDEDGDEEDEEEKAAELPGELRLAIARNRDGSPIGEEGLQFSQRIPAEVMKTGTGMILEDILAPGKALAHPSTIQLGVRSAMCAPLRVRRTSTGAGSQQVLGVLYVDSSTRARPFSPRLLHALESLASEAAQAIFNSRLYQECLEKRQIDAEMRIAREIQKGILPPNAFRNEWLEIHGSSQPSKDVGGDLLAYYPFEDGRVNLVVGDVSGKGVPAAILSAMLDGLCYGLGAQPTEMPDLGKVACELNRYLVSKSGLQKFVSAVCLTVRRSGQLSYVNAGHPPPLCISHGGSIEALRTGGMILGVFEEAEYKTGEVSLHPGDVLLLFSDGITEARARDGALFGLERLKAVLLQCVTRSAREIHDAVLAAVSRFTMGGQPSDDVTLMVVRFLGP